MADISNSTAISSEAKLSGSVPTEIQLRSLLEYYRNSEGWWIALLGTPMRGNTALPCINVSVWPAAIRSTIRDKLVEMGGVPLELPLIFTIGNEGKLSVRPAKKEELGSHAMNVELATEQDDPPSKGT